MILLNVDIFLRIIVFLKFNIENFSFDLSLDYIYHHGHELFRYFVTPLLDVKV